MPALHPITLSIVLCLASVGPQAASAASAATNSAATKTATQGAAKSSSKPEVQTQGPVRIAPPCG